MFKSLAVLMGGVFVGAVAMEVMRKAYPKTLDKVYERTREIASGAREAFNRGYEGVTSAPERSEPQA